MTRSAEGVEERVALSPLEFVDGEWVDKSDEKGKGKEREM